MNPGSDLDHGQDEHDNEFDMDYKVRDRWEDSIEQDVHCRYRADGFTQFMTV